MPSDGGVHPIGAQPRFSRQRIRIRGRPRRSAPLTTGCGGIGCQGWAPAFAGATNGGQRPAQQGWQAHRIQADTRCVHAIGPAGGEEGWCGLPEGRLRRVPAFRPASPPVRVGGANAASRNVRRVQRGGGRLRSSYLLSPAGSGSLFRAYPARARARVGAGAVRAPDCAREAEGALLPSASHGFSEMASPGRATPGEAAPESASLGTIIPHSGRCQAHIANKIQEYRK